ncbi:hypothetical protein HQ533_05560 [Candidatus Woesearchaeota archaeon]|nr:hypothetical protein [Candidatus Woesearchaeota archaeon]
MNEKEKKVLIELRKNSRKNFAKMARELQIPVTTVFEKHEKLQRIIIKHVSIADFSKAGFPIRTMLSIIPVDQQNMIEWLEQKQEVNNLYKVKDNNILTELLFQTLKQKHEFIEQIKQQGTLDIEEYYLIEELKRETMNV